jgi:hypothetical protein
MIFTVLWPPKGIVSRDEYFYMAFNYKQVLSVHALMVFTMFCSLDDEKSNSKFEYHPRGGPTCQLPP